MTHIDRYDYAFDPEGDAWAARVLRRIPPQGSVLELGPGPGAMTRADYACRLTSIRPRMVNKSLVSQYVIKLSSGAVKLQLTLIASRRWMC